LFVSTFRIIIVSKVFTKEARIELFGIDLFELIKDYNTNVEI